MGLRDGALGLHPARGEMSIVKNAVHSLFRSEERGSS